MSKIPQRIIDAIEEKADIVEVVTDILGDASTKGGLRKKGVNYTAICPFHDDHNDGNFMVRPKNVAKHPNTYRCFVCDAKGGPIQFLMNKEHMTFKDAVRWLGKKYQVPVDDVDPSWTPPPPRPLPPPLPTLVLPVSLLRERSGNTDGDSLALWIKSLPWDEVQQARLPKVFQEYYLGHSTVLDQWSHREHHFTVFWQIDADHQIRTAHYMKYKTNGHRMHKEDDPYNTDWLHSLIDRNGYTRLYDATKQEARQCLFGEHLLDKYPNAPVHIVESEKTALIMAIAYGNHPLQVWMACTGSSNITRDRLEAVIRQRRRIVLHPDRDGIEAWKIKMEQLHYDRCTIDTNLVTKWWRPEDGEKADCADVLVRILQEISTELHQATEDVKTIIDQLKIETNG